jgi:hypothetical protein
VSCWTGEAFTLPTCLSEPLLCRLLLVWEDKCPRQVVCGRVAKKYRSRLLTDVTSMAPRRFVSIGAATMIAGFAGLSLPVIAYAQPVVDEEARAALLKQPDGRLVRLKTKYNDIIARNDATN